MDIKIKYFTSAFKDYVYGARDWEEGKECELWKLLIWNVEMNQAP